MRLAGGHTNESFALDADRILRRSWPGKPICELADEARVLAALAGRTSFDTPCLVQLTDDARIFTRCRGTAGPRYLAPTQPHLARAAMRALRELHTALAPLPSTDTRDWAWLHRRLAAIAPGPHLPPGADRVLAHIARMIPTTVGPTQWLHGDYHLGNLLWTDDVITGVVDFDDTGCGAATAEAAMAALALARQPVEDAFTYDAGLWAAAIAAYDPTLASEPRVDLFCAYQVLVHLLAAQRGLWSLEPGIGFWPCWHTLAREST